MQTFLPYPDFEQSARCLDRLRLVKQRVEAKQLVESIMFKTGWSKHPASRMWKGYKSALCRYGKAICQEWISRGYHDELWAFFQEHDTGFAGAPEWLGDAAFHSAHRAALLAKDFEWYSQFGWSETPDINYIWPKPNLQR